MRKLSWPICGMVVALIASACFGAPPPPSGPHRDVVVFGDSNGWGIGCSLGDEGELVGNTPPFPCSPQTFSVKNETAGACTIAGGWTLLYNKTALNPSCYDWASRWPGILDERTPSVVVLSTGGWEIVDRWQNFPSAQGCSTGDTYNCPAPDYQWGDPNNLNTAKTRYKGQLKAAIDLFLSRGAKVIVTNSPYYAPTEAQVPGLADVWYEAYPATQPANWSPANANITYRSSKLKTEQFNAAVNEVLAQYAPANVQFFDLWQYTSPVNPGTGAPAFSDFQCPYPNVTTWPTNCPNGQAVQARTGDHGHFSYEGYQYVIMPYLLPVIQQMLS